LRLFVVKHVNTTERSLKIQVENLADYIRSCTFYTHNWSSLTN